MADGKVEIDVELNGSEAKRAASSLGDEIGRNASKGVDSATKDMSAKMTSAVKSTGDALTSLGTTYSAAVTLPIAGAAVAAGKAAIDIDTALTGVRKTVDGTEQQYEQLKEAAVEFSKTNAVDPAQILDIQALGAQLGYSIDELSMFGEVVSGLDIATNMDAETAATELAQFANIMGMSHDETKNYGSTIVELGNNFATTEADISHMSMRIAAAGKQIGLSEADVLGLATALSSMGIEAEAGGTAISTIMSKIDKDVAMGTEDLATWAQAAQMSTEDFAAAWRNNAVDALSAVLIGMDSATEAGGNMSVMLDELGITSIRQTDTLKRLASNSEFLGNAVDTANAAWEENMALDKEVENRNNSLAAQFEILKNKVMAVALEVGEPLMSALVDVVDAADPLIDALASGAKAFSDMSEDQQRLILTAVGLVAAFGPVTGIIGKVMTTVQSTRAGWKTVSEGMRTFKEAAVQATTATTKQTVAVQRDSAAIARAQAATAGYKVAQTQAKNVITPTTTAVQRQTVAMRASAAASKVSAGAMNIAKTAANGLKMALSTIAPIAIFAGITTAISAFTSAMSKADDEAEKSAKLHGGLSDAVSGVGIAADGTADAWKNEAKALQDLDIDAITDAHVELADSVRSTTQEATNSSALLDSYADSINRLADRSDLSKTDVAELQLAVKGVNDACGTGYTVAQDQDGAWRIMADGAIVAKDAINNLIDAQIRQIQLEATKENYKNVYAQLTEDADSYQTALSNVKQAQENYNAAYAEYMSKPVTTAFDQRKLNEYGEALQNAKNDLASIEGQYGETQSAANRLTEQMKLNQIAADESSSAFVKAAEGNMTWRAAVQGAGVDLVGFTLAMDEAGMSAEDMARMSSEDIMELAQAWKAANDEMAAASQDQSAVVDEQTQRFLNLQEKLLEIDTQLPDFVDNMAIWSEALQNAGIDTEAFSANLQAVGFNSQDLAQVLATQGTDGITGLIAAYQGGAEELRAWCEANGIRIPEALAASIEAGVPLTEAASQQATSAAQGEFDSMDLETVGQEGVIDFSSGIVSGEGQAKTAAANVGGVVEAGIKTTTDNAYRWGEEVPTNLASGMRAQSGQVESAAAYLAQLIANHVKHSVPKSEPLRAGGQGEALWGRHLTQNLAEGIEEGTRTDVARAMDGLTSEIYDSLEGGVALQIDASGRAVAKAFVVGFETEDPASQIVASMEKGMSALSIAASSGAANVYNDSHNQTLNFNQPVESPDEIARVMRMQNRYGLAGGYR